VAAIPALAAVDPARPGAGAWVEAHKAAWARLLETEDRTDDYEALDEAADRTGFNVCSSSTAPSTASKPASRGAARGR
jgi:hypothetical protein